MYHVHCVRGVQLCSAQTNGDTSGAFQLLGGVSEAQSKYKMTTGVCFQKMSKLKRKMKTQWRAQVCTERGGKEISLELRSPHSGITFLETAGWEQLSESFA